VAGRPRHTARAARSRAEGGGAVVGEAVVAAGAPGVALLAVEVDEPLGAEAVEQAVQRAHRQAGAALGELLDLRDQRVPVAGLARQGGQDERGGLGQCHA
jgi:hypothetical protein